MLSAEIPSCVREKITLILVQFATHRLDVKCRRVSLVKDDEPESEGH